MRFDRGSVVRFRLISREGPSVFRFIIALAAGAFLLVGCSAKPERTSGGISITTTPDNALVVIDGTIPPTKAMPVLHHTTSKIVTPYRNEEDSFLRYTEGRKPDSEVIWTFDIQKPGYKQMSVKIPGHDISGQQHWDLIPANSPIVAGKPPIALLQIVSEKYDGKDVKRIAGDTWAPVAQSEFDTTINGLLSGLSGQQRYGAVTTSPSTIPDGTEVVNFDIYLDEKEDRHMGEAAAKGFVTGFFTLGLVGYVMPNRYSFETSMKVVMRRPGTADRVFETKSAGDSEWDVNKAGEFFAASEALKRGLRRATVEKIVAELKASP
jgi:hypothetical protein